jgi:cytochrome c55X
MSLRRWPFAVVFAAVAAVASAAADPAPARQRELLHLLTQDCGSCHGLTLKGGLGPALTPDALAGKAPVMLQAVILHGRPGTPMPPWKAFMTEIEAAWLVEQLRAGVPDAR